MATFLKEKHPLGEHAESVTFTTEGHIYARHGKDAPISVTALLGKYFPKFKPVEVVDKYYPSWKRRGLKYEEIIQNSATDSDGKKAILAQWEANKKEACRLGTMTHLSIEMFLNRFPLEECGNPEIENETNAFLQWFSTVTARGWVPFRTELLLFALDASGDICVGGAIDALFKDENGDFVLVDWKRTKDPFGPDVPVHPFTAHGSGPASELLDISLHKYSLQLAIYSNMLKTITGIDVGNRRMLVRLSKDGYEEVDAFDERLDGAAAEILACAGSVGAVATAQPRGKVCADPAKKQKTRA